MTSSELIQNLDCEALLVNLSKGSKLNEAEVQSLKDFISYSSHAPRNRISLEELYSAVTVLNKADDPSLAYLVTQFLDFQDSLTVGYALETLVCKWNYYEDIQEQIIKFALGMPWDKDQDLRISALTCIKSILRTKKNDLSQQTTTRFQALTVELKKDKSADSFLLDLVKEVELLF